MSNTRIFIAIFIAAVCTLATRAVPFLLFRGDKPIPSIVRYLGEALPPAVIALLVIYCVRNVNWLSGFHGIPEILSIAVVAILHLWKRSNLLSIGVGTALYMFLIQTVFVI